MSKNAILTLDESSFKKLEEAWRSLYFVNPKMEDLVHPKISKELQSIERVLHTLLKPVQQQRDQELTDTIDGLNAIAQQHQFRSVWSAYELATAKNMNARCPFRVQQVKYTLNDKSPLFPIIEPITTWLSLWKALDHIIEMSGDHHHIFIEGLRAVGSDGTFELQTGS